MQRIKQFFYNIHPIKHLLLLMITSTAIMKYYEFSNINIGLTLLAILAYLVLIVFTILLMIEGQYSSERKYVSTILIAQDENFEPMHVYYFKKYKTAKLSIAIQIWLLRHFNSIKKTDLVVSVISK